MALNPEEIQTLSILDAIEDNNRATQRELSKTTGLNLAKVNFLLRRLAEKGQVKLRNISQSPNRLRYLYILTPRGIAEKSRLTIRFASRTLREYSKPVALINQNLAKLQSAGVARVILIGATNLADMIVKASDSVEGLDVVGIVAPAKAGAKRHGVPIIDNADGLRYDCAIPCDDVEVYSRDLMKAAGIPPEKLRLM